MKRFRLLSAALAGSLTLAAADFSPWDAWKNGYTLYEKGEQFRDKGDYLKALNSFEQARKLYEQLRKNRPDWNRAARRLRPRNRRRQTSRRRQRPDFAG